MAWDLEGRVALITGGASGHRRRTRAPTRGAGHAPRPDRRRPSAAGSDRGHVPGTETAVADVRDAAGLTAAIDDLARRLGGIDSRSPTPGSPPADRCGWSRRRRSRRRSTSTCWASGAPSRAALPHVLERRGHLLLISSAAAVLPAAGLGAYSASKAGVEALGRSLRVELAPHGVTRRDRLLPVPGHADGRGRRSLAGLRAAPRPDALADRRARGRWSRRSRAR